MVRSTSGSSTGDDFELIASLASHRTLSDFELLMLRSESEPRGRSSGIALGVLDVVPDWERFQRVYERASRVFLRLRQKVVAPVIALGPAEWVIDPDFDIKFHVRRVVLPAPGSMRQLLDLAELESALAYDLGRPLWSVILVEGLDEPGCKAAVITRIHHAVTDGVGSLELSKQLYDLDRDEDRGPMPPVPVPEDLDSLELTRRQLRRLPFGIASGAVRVVRAVGRAGGRVITSPGAAIGDVSRLAGSAQRMFATPPATPSPLLRRRGLGRRFEYLEFPLQPFRRAARAAHGSVNDAYLSAVCGTLGRYHDALGVPIETIGVGMPVSTRQTGDTPGGNQWTGVTLSAPVGEKDPVKRIELIRTQVIEALEDTSSEVFNLFGPIATRIPPALLGALFGGAAGHDVQATNIPGYVDQPFIAGAKMVKNLPFGPLPGIPIMFALYTEGGNCFVGVNYDTMSFVDQDLLVTALYDGFAEILALDPESTTTPSPQPPTARPATTRAPAKRAPVKLPAAKRAAAKRAPAGRAAKATEGG